MSDSIEPSDPISEVHPPEVAPEGEAPTGTVAAGLPESEHSAAEHAFPTDRSLEKWINEAHG